MSTPSNADLREIYGLLREIKEDLASMKTASNIDHERIDKCEQKIDNVESILDRMMGAKGVMAFLLSALGALLIFIFQVCYDFIKGGN